ncbi:uncharacterized protein DNG_01316 [Cephalotrichum gorgonifer]|uniref:HTH La-type RNA-binding domain-containing protein n=1 Tax=Cephalotrichum gorgonifer TaxID=2041049 RepID=A0AAE8MQW9_9PEZI|nr:uncharacterized protein DNG_01316 [Cephalotrichum gorgonifer]
MPTATFSYAQAAKGQKGLSGSTSPALSPSASSTPTTGAQDVQIKDGSLNDALAPAANARNDDLETIRDSKTEPIAAVKALSVSDASCTTHNDTIGSSGTSSSGSRRDDDTNSELSAQRSVKDARSHGSASKTSQSRQTSTSADSKRPRRERKPKGAANGAKNADKESDAAEGTKEAPAPPPKVELFEAPIPTVNPWQSTARKGAAANAGSQAKTVSDGPATNGLANHRRGGDGDASRKGEPKSDARRMTERPPGNDTAHWPTPDTANKEEVQQKSAETTPVQDDQSAQKGKVPKKDWVKMDFVPTVSFETPLPQHKGARPRGGARGGRDGAARGGHSANLAKDGEKGTGPSTGPAKVNGEVRDGPRDASATTAGSGTSVPPTSTKRDAPNFRDQRKQPVPTATRSKEAATNEQPRDKHENRGERTRGGPRARGNYHGATSQLNNQHTAFAGYPTNGASRQQNPYSPPIRQNQFNNYGSASSRGGRGGRAGSNAARASGPSNGNGRQAPSSVMTYDHSFHGASMMGYPQAPSPAFFFDPFLVSTLTAQLSWYFSVQNLCRDMFLRGNMDSQGFVPLALIAGFNRVSSLLQAAHDPVQYVRQACFASRDVEFVVGDDGVERLRTLNNPLHWVLPMEDRCDMARNAGPANFFAAGQQYPAHPGMVHGGFPAGAPAPMNAYAPPYGESQANTFASPVSPELVNGHSAGQGNEANQNTTLKATVPEFAPRNSVADNGKDSSAPAESQTETTASTVEVSNNAEVAASS